MRLVKKGGKTKLKLSGTRVPARLNLRPLQPTSGESKTSTRGSMPTNKGFEHHKPNPDAWKSRPVAKTMEELDKNRGLMRPPEPRACTYCGVSYPYPCDGSGCFNMKLVK